MNNFQNNDNVISYLAAIAPALLQLIGVISIGLVNVLDLNRIVLKPEYINLVNLLVVLLAFSIISLSSFWDYNKFSLLDHQSGEKILSQTKKFWGALKNACKIAFASTILFLALISNKDLIVNYVGFWIFIQWTLYIIAMVSVSFIIYAFALLKIQEKRSRSVLENYIPRLVDSLRRYGHIKDPDIIIHSVNRDTQEAIVKLGGATKYKVKTDFTGEMIEIDTF